MSTTTIYKGKTVKTIDCTPTWEGILPTMFMCFENFVEQLLRSRKPLPQITHSLLETKKEFTRMAKLADDAKNAKKLLNDCDTAFAVLFIGSDHGITPQAEKCCKETAKKVQEFLQGIIKEAKG